jgi:hypothetical protein
MARHHRDHEVVLTFWKMFARDPAFPAALRVHCVNNLALAAGVIKELPLIPGTYRPRSVEPIPGASVEAKTEVEVEATAAVADVKSFLKQLGGANGDPQT